MLPDIMLQKEPDWIESLSDGDAIILGGDGDAKVKVPSFLIAATSQLVRNILCGADQLPLAYFTPVISLDSVSGEVLGLLRDLIIKGEAKASELLLGQLQDCLKMLSIEFEYRIKSDCSGDSGHMKSIEEKALMKDQTRVDDDLCQFCYGVFKTKYSRDRHVKQMHREIDPEGTKSDIKCPECDRTFSHRPFLEKHMIQFHSVSVIVEENTITDKHSCSVCQKTFENKTHLIRHRKIHEQVLQKFPCKDCSTTFARKDSLLKHRIMLHFRGKVRMDSVRNRFEESSVCQICGKDFGSDKVKFERHFFYKACQKQNKQIVELTDEDRYACEQCKKSYKDKNNLKRHILSKHIKKS